MTEPATATRPAVPRRAAAGAAAAPPSPEGFPLHRRTPQGVLTVVTPVPPGEAGALERCLGKIQKELDGDLEGLDQGLLAPGDGRFRSVESLHFLRWALVPAPDGERGAGCPPILVFSANHDGSPEDHLKELVAREGSLLEEIYGRGSGGRAKDEPLDAYLLRHRRAAGMFYNGAVFRTRAQIEAEGDLCAGIADLLGDNRSHAGVDVRTAVQRELRVRAAGDRRLAELLRRPPRRSRWKSLPRLRRGLRRRAAVAVLSGLVSATVALAAASLANLLVAPLVLITGSPLGWSPPGWLLRAMVVDLVVVTLLALAAGSYLLSGLHAARVLGRRGRWILAVVGTVWWPLRAALLGSAVVLGRLLAILGGPARAVRKRSARAFRAAGSAARRRWEKIRSWGIQRVGRTAERLLEWVERGVDPGAWRRLGQRARRKLGRAEAALAAGGENEPCPVAEAALETLEALEDKHLQNQMTLVNRIRPDRGRHPFLRVTLWILERLVRRVFVPLERLGGLTTIHFAHWVLLPERGQLLFISNYDGVWHRYLDDFTQHGTVQGLNAIWTHTVGFPETEWLFFGGAGERKNQKPFKEWARRYQAPTDVWYSAYPFLSTRRILRHTEVREGLFGWMSPGETRRWLEKL